MRVVHRIVWVVAAWVLGVIAAFAVYLRLAQTWATNSDGASWLAARHLHTGLSGYWESNVVTLTSGGRVQIRMVAPAGGRLTAPRYESNAAWYDPARNTADFVVLFRGIAGYPGFTSTRAVLATFGKPARTWDVGSYRVLVWNKNLLSELARR